MIRISKVEKRIFWMMDKIAAKYESYGALPYHVRKHW